MIRVDGITIDRKRRRIEHGGASIQFCRWKRRACLFRLACALLLAGPKNKRELSVLLYGHEAEGGPLTYVESVDVMSHTLKKRFATIGIELRSIPAPGARRYYAEPRAIDYQYQEAAE